METLDGMIEIIYDPQGDFCQGSKHDGKRFGRLETNVRTRRLDETPPNPHTRVLARRKGFLKTIPHLDNIFSEITCDKRVICTKHSPTRNNEQRLIGSSGLLLNIFQIVRTRTASFPQITSCYNLKTVVN